MTQTPNVFGTLLDPFSPTFVTYDLEFIDDGQTIDLVSLGMKSGDGRTLYVINQATCVECEGHYDSPKCVGACPVDCIVKAQ